MMMMQATGRNLGVKMQERVYCAQNRPILLLFNQFDRSSSTQSHMLRAGFRVSSSILVVFARSGCGQVD